MGWGELAVLALVGLFVLGPERLPGAIRTLTTAVAQFKGYVAAAKDHLDSEEFAELREPLEQLRGPLAELRAADPRRALRDAWRADPASTPATTPDGTRNQTEPQEAQPGTDDLGTGYAGQVSDDADAGEPASAVPRGPR